MEQTKFNKLIEETEDAEILREAIKDLFVRYEKESPEAAEDFTEALEGSLHFYNYLTKNEAEKIVSGFVNSDGTKGPKWKDPEAFFEDVKKNGGETESEPCYNKWALWVTTNMVASDCGTTLDKYTEGDKAKYFAMAYDFALDHLADTDRQKWVRPYFGL